MSIVIVDYGMGNVGSIANMLKAIGTSATISSDRHAVAKAKKLILPGVGSFDAGIGNIRSLQIYEILCERVQAAGVPILGICLGMQLMTRHSHEGVKPGFGWLQADTVRFSFQSEISQLKVPHIGWNAVRPNTESSLFRGLESDGRFYFVHSYHVRCDDERDVLSTTTYGHPFVSAVGHGYILGVQFHPEKSHRYGMRLLKNFVELY